MTKLYKRENNILLVKNTKTQRWIKAEYVRKDGRVVKSSSYYKLVREGVIPTYDEYKQGRKAKREETTKRYNVSMSFLVQSEEGDEKTKYITLKDVKLRSDKIDKESYLRKTLSRRAQEWVDNMPATYKDGASTFLRLLHYKMLPIKQVNLKDVPMKGAPLTYCSLGETTNFKDGLCVIDFIYKELKDKPCYKSLTYEKLKIDFPFYKNGITTEEIINWAKEKKYISIYAVSPFKCVFESFVADVPRYALVFLCNNGHCYPITDEEQRQQIFKKNNINIKKIDYHIDSSESYIYVDDMKRDYNDLLNSKYDQKLILLDCGKNQTTMYELVNDCIKHSNTMIENIHFDSDKQVSAFVYNDKIYIDAPDYEARKEVADALHSKLDISELKFSNQSFTQISKNIMKFFLHKNPEKSEYNSQVLSIIDTYRPKPFVVKYRNEMNGSAFDIKKSYSSFLINNTYDYPIFTVCDEVKPFNSSDDITPGLYYVDRVIYLTVDNKIFLDRGFYTHMTIDKAIKRGAITKDEIKYCIKAGHHHKGDYFKDLVEFCFNHFDQKEAKKVVNSFTGSLGTRYKHETYGCITDSYDTAMGCCYTENYNKRECKTVLLNDYYFVRSVQKTRLDSDFIPFYMMIIEGGLWNLVDLHDAIYEPGVSEVIYCNTDAIGIKRPKKGICDDINNLEFFKELPFYHNQLDIGGFRCEQWKPRGKSPMYNLNPVYDYYFDEPLWNEYEEPENYQQYLDDLKQMGSFFIQGDGGSGKSYTVVQLMKEMTEKSFIFLSFTNKVVIELKKKGAEVAYTLDKFFHKDNKRDLSKIHVLVIDEFSMIPMQFLSKLIKIKKKYSHLEFMILGDEKQLPPVITDGAKCYKYTNTFVMKYLCKFNYVQARYKPEYSRYDQTTYDILTEFVEKQQLSEKLKDKTLKPGLMQNLCYYRKTAEEVNEECRKLFIKNNPNAVKITNDFYVGMKIISNENNPILDIYNSETFEIVDYKKPNISIKSDLTGETIQVSVLSFKKKFDLAYCITIHRSQGSTLEGEYNIYDIYSLSFELMYVAMSRCRNIDNVHFDYIEPFIFWKQEYTDNSVLRKGVYKDNFGEKYENGKIYQIKYNDEIIYIGQTTSEKLETRLKQHIKDAETETDRFHSYIKNLEDKTLLQIELIKTYPCRSLYELLAEEERHIRSFEGELLNTINNPIVKPTKIKQERKIIDKERFIRDYIKVYEQADRFMIRHKISSEEQKEFKFKYGKSREAARERMEAKKNELIGILFQN